MPDTYYALQIDDDTAHLKDVSERLGDVLLRAYGRVQGGAESVTVVQADEIPGPLALDIKALCLISPVTK